HLDTPGFSRHHHLKQLFVFLIIPLPDPAPRLEMLLLVPQTSASCCKLLFCTSPEPDSEIQSQFSSAAAGPSVCFPDVHAPPAAPLFTDTAVDT
ncbi:hypothetical protein XENOCAPTIV_026318, partial [Xenoophorus captivus]